MSPFTGHRANGFVLGAALHLVACSDEPDALLEVSRMRESSVTVALCSGTPPSCPRFYPLFKTETEPVTVVRTVAIHLDEAVDSLTVQFQQTTEPQVCHYLVLPFLDSPRTVIVKLPADDALVEVDGCDDCMPLVCGQ